MLVSLLNIPDNRISGNGCNFLFMLHNCPEDFFHCHYYTTEPQSSICRSSTQLPCV